MKFFKRPRSAPLQFTWVWKEETIPGCGGRRSCRCRDSGDRTAPHTCRRFGSAWLGEGAPPDKCGTNAKCLDSAGFSIRRNKLFAWSTYLSVVVRNQMYQLSKKEFDPHFLINENTPGFCQLFMKEIQGDQVSFSRQINDFFLHIWPGPIILDCFKSNPIKANKSNLLLPTTPLSKCINFLTYDTRPYSSLGIQDPFDLPPKGWSTLQCWPQWRCNEFGVRPPT